MNFVVIFNSHTCSVSTNRAVQSTESRVQSLEYSSGRYWLPVHSFEGRSWNPAHKVNQHVPGKIYYT